ncbi:MAG: cysteine--tRNA ligase, partial [Chloroflexi bacterium RBG_16_48_7]
MKIFNTLSGQKEEFQPLSDPVTMYVCGVTVYDDCHIGHAMSYILFDVIRRYLEFKGYNVKLAQNFTDIDDKIINRANQLGIPSKDLAGKYIAEYFKDMDALNIRRATIYPRATEEVPKIIEIIETLIKKGFAYELDGSVYFRVKKFEGYGKLSHQKIDEMQPETSALADKKDSALDFALWKASKPGEPAWKSPWGEGRPGWHIECSAMSLKYLGETIDIHGGGQDLVFPHHENEITQSESITGKKPFARFWIHNGLLQFSGSKMSKSLGNLITVKNMLNDHSADAIRLFILSSHYRTPLLYSEESLLAAETGMDRVRQASKPGEKDNNGSDILDVSALEQKFTASMDDDFNTAQAMAALFDMVREINRGREQNKNVAAARDTLVKLANVLGFTLKKDIHADVTADPLIELLLTIRSDLRGIKQWQLADKIRDELLKQRIVL